LGREGAGAAGDYFEQMLGMAEQLLREDKAYCDCTPKEEMAKHRFDGTPAREGPGRGGGGRGGMDERGKSTLVDGWMDGWLVNPFTGSLLCVFFLLMQNAGR